MTLARATHRFFLHTLALLALYVLFSVIVGLKFLPGDVTQTSLPFNQVSTLAVALLDLVVVGGLLGAGIYVTIQPDQMPMSRLLRIAVLLWLLLTILTLAAGLLNLLVAASAFLALLRVIVIALVVAYLARNRHEGSAVAFVWTLGMVLSAASTLIGLLPTNDFLLATLIHTLTSGVNHYIAHVLAGAALVYGLLARFSGITPLSAEKSLYTTAGLLAAAGALVTLSALELNNAWISDLSTLLVPLLYLVFAAHVYRAFSSRAANSTQAAHWAALGVLLLLLGIGMLGSVHAAAHLWTAGTRLSDLQVTLAQWAIVAIILGVISQAAAESRSQPPSRIASTPFWLVAFGSIGSALALAGAGLVQVYLERILSIGYLDTQALLIPLHTLWILGLLLLALGVLAYTLIFWLRRPRPHEKSRP